MASQNQLRYYNRCCRCWIVSAKTAPGRTPLVTDGASRLLGVITPDITAAELARKLAVSQQAIYNWTHGHSRPVLGYREKIAKLTGVPIESWLTDEERRCAGMKPDRKAG